jgi:hypothetical protein
VEKCVVDGAFFWPALVLFKIGLQLRFGLIGVGNKFLPRAKRQFADITIGCVRSAADESDDSEPAVWHWVIMAGRQCGVKYRPRELVAAFGDLAS